MDAADGVWSHRLCGKILPVVVLRLQLEAVLVSRDGT